MSTGEVLDAEKRQAPLDRIGYDTKEQQYFSYMTRRLRSARDMRDQVSPWWDGMSFLQYLENNERMMNATIEPKTDPRDWRSRARKRTVWSKTNALQGKIMDENFITEFSAYDDKNELDMKLSRAITAAVQYTKDIEHSDEKEPLAFHEMLKHGFVPVQEVFDVRERTIKQLDPLSLAVGAAPDQRKWTEKTIPYKRQCVKQVIRNDSFYLGNIMLPPGRVDLQPFIFVRTCKSYEEAKSIFGNYDRWKYVRPGYGVDPIDPSNAKVEYLDQWRLGELSGNEVEIIEYQDKWNDEYQIFINGVMMLPVGYPLPWETKEYNVTFRVLYPISAHCAYGHGLCHVMRSNSEVRDFIMRYMVDKTFQDLLPPMVSKAARTLSKDIWIPGRTTHSVAPDDVKALVPQGMPQSAVQMLQYFEQSLDEDSVAKVVEGQDTPGSSTAYEIGEQMKQAMKTLGPVLFAFMWMLRDLDTMRAANIMENLAKPKNTDIDPKTKAMVEVYDQMVIENADLPTGERGTHVISFGDQTAPNAKNTFDLFAEEVKKRKDGKPTSFAIIDPKFIRNAQYRFQATVKSSPRKNSDFNKLMLEEMLTKAMNFFGANINMDYMQNKFAKAWDEDPQKMFNPAQPAGLPGMDAMAGAAAPGGAPAPSGNPAMQGVKNQALAAAASNAAQSATK